MCVFGYSTTTTLNSHRINVHFTRNTIIECQFFFSFAARCSVNFFILIIIIFPLTCTSCFRCSLCTEKKFGYYARLCIIGRGNRELMYAITDSSELTEICSVIVLHLSIMCMKVDDNFRSLSRTMRVYIERWQTNEPNERERGRELTNAHIEWDVWLMSASVCAWLCRPLYSVLYGDIIHSLLYIDGKTETERRHRLNSYCLMCVYYIQIHRCIEKHVEHEQHTHTHIRTVSHAHTHRRTYG